MDSSSFDSPYLISCEDLVDQFKDPDLRIFDCTQRLVKDPKVYVRAEACYKEYSEAHIPGSGYIDIKADLSDPNVVGNLGLRKAYVQGMSRAFQISTILMIISLLLCLIPGGYRMSSGKSTSEGS